jgi:hypothetical protein
MIGCFACHSADLKTLNDLHPEQTPGYYGGGTAMLDLDGKTEIVASNITMNKEKGIGKWTEQQFVDAVRYCKNQPAAPCATRCSHTRLWATQKYGAFLLFWKRYQKYSICSHLARERLQTRETIQVSKTWMVFFAHFCKKRYFCPQRNDFVDRLKIKPMQKRRVFVQKIQKND